MIITQSQQQSHSVNYDAISLVAYITRPRLGYVKDITAPSGLCLDQTIAPFIKQTFEIVGTRKGSLRQALKVLTDNDIVGRQGRPFQLSSLGLLLADPFYAGKVKGKDGTLIRGDHHAIISVTLFEKVQSRMRQRRCS